MSGNVRDIVSAEYQFSVWILRSTEVRNRSMSLPTPVDGTALATGTVPVDPKLAPDWHDGSQRERGRVAANRLSLVVTGGP